MDSSCIEAISHNISNLSAKEYTIAFGRVTPVRNKINKDSKHPNNEEKKDDTKTFKRSSFLRKSVSPNNGLSDVAGEPASTSRKTKNVLIKKVDSQKSVKPLKPSQIPRRNSLIKRKPKDVKTQRHLVQNRDVQRVEIYSTPPDFKKTVKIPVSIASARPIPTLGQIYANPIITNDVYNDILGSQNESYVQSIPEISDNLSDVSPCGNDLCETETSTVSENKDSEDINKNRESTSKCMNFYENAFKTTNDNVKEWLSSELDKPTRDNESGYDSISPQRNPLPSIKSNSSRNTKADILKKYSLLFKKLKETKKSVSATDISKISSSGNSMKLKFIKECNTHEIKNKNPILKTNTETKLLKPQNAAFYATFKYPSTPNPANKPENCFNHATIPSYVDCASEVLQKTTNFEIEGRDTHSTIGKDLNTQDDLSSRGCEHLDDVSGITDQYDWILPSSQCSAIFKTSKESNTTVSSWQPRRDRSSDFSVKSQDENRYHEYFYHYCWRKEVIKENDRRSLRDATGRCSKCQKFRKNFKKHDKISKKFITLKNRMRLGRVCKHRLNRVWKKTTQRFTDWSKSKSRCPKMHMLHYLRRYHLDNADVQTTILVYHETGTDAVAKAQRSAAMATDTKQSKAVSSATSTVYRMKTNHVNVGPSIFPFIKESKPKLAPQATSHQKHKPNKDVDKTVNNSKNVETEAVRLVNASTSFENITSIEKVDKSSDAESLFLPSDTSTFVYLKDKIPQSICTPNMMITCNNAATEIKFTPLVDDTANSSEDSETGKHADLRNAPCISSVEYSERSASKECICNILDAPAKSKRQELNTKVSTGTITLESSFRDRPSVVTDTIIPYKRLENKGVTKLTTRNGTVLSCAGTKITSVSSANLQTGCEFGKTTTSTAMSTNVPMRHIQCYTAPSFFRRRHRDTSIGLDYITKEFKRDGTTSMSHIGDGLKCHIAVSTTKLIDKASFSCGSPRTQHSFNDEFCPIMATVYTNTEREAPSELITLPKESPVKINLKNVTDSSVQYSNRDDSLGSSRIGHSRLMSVRMLGDSMSEIATQVQPLLINAETRMIPRGMTSAAVVTSYITFNHSKQTATKENNTDTPKNCDVIKEIQKAEQAAQKRQNSPEPVQPKEVSQALNPSVVISSNLNATKWMTGCTKEDYQSILDISEITVSESLERATIAVASNALKAGSVNQDAAVNCVTAKPLGVVSTDNLCDVVPCKDAKAKKCKGKNVDSRIKNHVDDILEDRSDAKKDCQGRPTVDAGVNVKLPLLIERKSKAVVTSRHILTKPQKCDKKQSQNSECLFVYDRARCVIHERANSRCNHKSKEKHSRNSTVEFVTSIMKPSCNRSSLLGEVLCPKVHKTMYETSRLIGKERSLSKEIENVRNKAENRSIQAVCNNFNYVICPFCSKKFHTKSTCGDSDMKEDELETQLATSCRYYSNLLSKNITCVKENFKKHMPIPIYQTATSQAYIEACTMKPSGRKDEKCEAKLYPECSCCENCYLCPTRSTVDIRGKDGGDLQAVYHMLTAIEGRVRRLKQNL